MKNPFDLSGKVSLVTGGAGGIGLGIAEALGRAGSALVLWDLHASRLADAASHLEAVGIDVLTSVVDVTTEVAVAEAMQAALARFFRIDVAVAAAGVLGEAAPFIDTTLAGWRRVHAVNSEGVFLTLREVSRHMVGRAKQDDPGGVLIGVASLAAIDGAPRGEAYSASKGGVVALMRSLAVELARYGIRANSISPGWIATEMTTALQSNPAVAERVVSRIPMRRWGAPADLGALAVYLACDASAYHTADSFVVDGGYVAF